MAVELEPTAVSEDMTSQDNDGSVQKLEMDSGLQAWLQVFGSWLLFANTWLVHGASVTWRGDRHWPRDRDC